jgi:hypothetical protein
MTPEVKAIQTQFEVELANRNPQLRPAPASILSVETGDLGMATNYIVATYNRPSWTIELPFKAVPGARGEPDSLLAAGCMHFGCTCVDALNAVLD